VLYVETQSCIGYDSLLTRPYWPGRVPAPAANALLERPRVCIVVSLRDAGTLARRSEPLCSGSMMRVTRVRPSASGRTTYLLHAGAVRKRNASEMRGLRQRRRGQLEPGLHAVAHGDQCDRFATVMSRAPGCC
jgi:hypothetical protein